MHSIAFFDAAILQIELRQLAHHHISKLMSFVAKQRLPIPVLDPNLIASATTRIDMEAHEYRGSHLASDPRTIDNPDERIAVTGHHHSDAPLLQTIAASARNAQRQIALARTSITRTWIRAAMPRIKSHHQASPLVSNSA